MRNTDNKLLIDRVLFRIKAATPRQILQNIALYAGTMAQIEPIRILAALEEQETQSPSAAGLGAAIPQARLPELTKPLTLLATLPQAVDYNACDHKAVDVIAAILSPQSDGPIHLQRLSQMARILKDEAFLDDIRSADSEDALYALLSGTALYNIAA